MSTARRTHGFRESVIRGMSRLAREHRSINLAQGFPNFPAPDLLKDPVVTKVNDTFVWWAVAGFVVPFVLGALIDRSWTGGLTGMLWGVGSELHENAVVDPRYGLFVNHDLAGYHVPVHADVPAVEALMLAGFDDKSNELGSKGVGELGICGAGAAVANAIYNACGVRVRDYPITPDKILSNFARPSLAQRR